LPISSDSPVKWASPYDTGEAVIAILQHPGETSRNVVELYSEKLNPTEMLAHWSLILQKTATYAKVTPEVYIDQNLAMYSPLLGVDLAENFVPAFSQHMCFFEDMAKRVGNWKTAYVEVQKVCFYNTFVHKTEITGMSKLAPC
jgi:hypothetical protein